MFLRIIRFLVLAAAAVEWTFPAVGAPLAAPGNQAAAYIREDDRYIYAGNDRVELSFRKDNGRLDGLVDKSSRLDFLAKKDAYWGPFIIQVTVGGNDEYINGGRGSRFQYSAGSDKDGSVLSLTWDQFSSSRATPLDIIVRVTVHIPATEGLTYWSISVTNNENLIIRQVGFPDLEGMTQLSRDGMNDELTHPGFTGVLFQDPVNNVQLSRGYGWEMMYPSTSAPMQLMTYSSREYRSGLYMATRDTDGHAKFFNLAKPASDWINMQVMHRPPLIPKTSFTPAFDVVLGVFSGDWYDAAQIYRTWALQQTWAKAAGISDASQPTGWFPQLPLHQWLPTYPDCRDLYHFSLVPTASQDTAQFMGQPMALDWIGWEREGWYVGYPDVFPPKEGWTSFEDTVRATHATGNRIWVVPDTGSYSDRMPGWAADKTGAAVGDSGQYLSSYTFSECGKDTTFRSMCPATTAWRDRVRGLVLPLASRQVDMIQLDGFPMSPLPCSNPAHNHPPGGGNWWYLGYRDMFEGIKREARQLNPGVVFSAEGFAETYLSFLDSIWDPFTTGLSPTSVSGLLFDIGKFRLIPMWHTVYKEKAPIQSGIAFLNHSDYNSEMDFNVYGFGKALVWGEVPTTWYNYVSLANLTEPGAAEVAAYLKRIVGLRSNEGRDFLVNGRMLRTPEIGVPLFRNAGMNPIPYTMTEYPPFDVPSVLGSSWQAPNGDAGFVFTNISRDPVKFDLKIDPASLLLPASARYDVALVRNGVYSVVGTAMSLPATLPVSTDPRDAMLFRISPSATGSTLLPAIAQWGVAEAMNFQQGVTASSWISIFGRNLSATARDWTGSKELSQNHLPFSLDGVSVTIDDKPAAVFFVSPGQINVLSPVDIGTGALSVVVRNAAGQTAPATAIATSALPALYAPFANGSGNLFVTAVAANGDLLGKVGLDPRVKRALRPGEVVLLFGTGFGGTSPVAPTDSIFGGAYPLAALPTILFGKAMAPVAFGGIVSPGLYQFNLTVPEVPDGDMPITAQIGTIQSSNKLMVSVKH